jgi:Arc/MetJ family transcription regulator
MEVKGADLLPLYSCLGYYTAEIAREKGTIDDEQRQDFQQILGRAMLKQDMIK